GNQIFAHMGGNLEGRESHEIYNTMTGELQSPFSTTIRYAFDIIWNESSILLQDNNLLSFRSNIDGSEILNFSTFMDVIEWDEKRGRIYGRGFPSDGINYSTSVLVIDDSTGNLVQEFPYVEAIFDIAISPNGETLAVSGAGGLISLIDVFSGNTLQTLKQPQMITYLELAWHFDSVHLVGYAGVSHTIDIWHTESHQLIEQITVDQLSFPDTFAWRPRTNQLSYISETVQALTVDTAVPPYFIPSLQIINHDDPDSSRTLLHDDMVTQSATDILTLRGTDVPDGVGSIIFDDGNSRVIQNNAPYDWVIPGAGNYTLTATPYSGKNGTGTVGTPLTISFTVIDE
ncbi:MAG: hypothetical protein ACPG7F_21905, partial [Aggregatilineales bacterium]